MQYIFLEKSFVFMLKMLELTLNHFVKRNLICIALRPVQTKPTLLVQHHHPTLLDATCWPRLNTMLDDVGLGVSLLKIFVQHRATFLA